MKTTISMSSSLFQKLLSEGASSLAPSLFASATVAYPGLSQRVQKKTVPPLKLIFGSLQSGPWTQVWRYEHGNRRVEG